jgi:CBS domain-containing protein
MKVTVATVMTRELVAAHPTTSDEELVRLFRACGMAVLPVVRDDGRLLGMVAEADLQRRRPRRTMLGRPAAYGQTAGELMSQAVTLAPEASVAAAARLLRHPGVRQLAVVDPDGHLLGIVSRRDLLAVFLRPDEEIRDEIQRRILGVLLSFDPGMVSVEVRGGVVILQGVLPWRTQADELLELARAVEGVVAVDDQLTIEDHPGHADRTETVSATAGGAAVARA